MTILWLKAFHVSFMVAWFAGIFYLPRLFVNHAEATEDIVKDRLKGMEQRLLKFVTPFAVLTIALGVAIIFQYGSDWFAQARWLHIKITLVLVLIIYHAYCFKLVAMFQRDENKFSPRFFRIFNELPVLILFGVVILAYVKP